MNSWAPTVRRGGDDLLPATRPGRPNAMLSCDGAGEEEALLRDDAELAAERDAA